MFPVAFVGAFLTTVFVIVCVLLVIVVLLQKGRGGGVGGIFGGGGQSAFGARTGDVFTWVTITLVALFLVMGAGINRWFHPPRPKVDTPRFVPVPGPIDKPILVSITCQTRGAKIFYTYAMGGDEPPEPTRASLPYEPALPVSPGMTIKAKAFLQGWGDSDAITGSYPHPDQLPAPAPDTRTTTLPAPGPPATQPAGPDAPAAPPTQPAAPESTSAPSDQAGQ